MPENSLQVRLEAIDGRPGHFMLMCNSSQYTVVVKPEASVTFTDWLRRLHLVLVGHNDPSGQLGPLELLHNVGTWLWQAILPQNTPVQEREALAYALRTGRTPLLLALPDELAGLPWELLCDPLQPFEQGFLARRRPFMRLVAPDTTVSPVEPPLRVLLLISSPLSLGENSRVDVESERAAVEEATREMREAGLLHLFVEDIVTPRRVQQALVRFKPHILHYIGHGGYDEQVGGVLLWEEEYQGNEYPLSDARLADLLRPRNLHAVVLHACQTGRSNARADVCGVAGILVHEGIPAVIAQQASFTYESSQRASEAWYTALAAGQGFVHALFEVRQALAQEDRPDWAAPILQGSPASLVPVLDATAQPGPPDPLLKIFGAAADLPAPTGVFVGRQRELRGLRLMLENTPGSGPVLALITGPGGVGKSTLAAQAITRYGGGYKAALTLSCQGYQSVELFLQRMGEFLKRQGASGFLEQTLPDPKLSPETKIEEAIAVLNQAGPFLIVVDNLESAQHDDHTLRDAFLLYLLQKLLTNLRGGRVLITGRYAVENLLPDGKFAAHLLQLDLDDLSPYETNQLLTRHPTLAVLGEVVREMIVREFGGLPYVYDLLNSKAAEQSLELLIHDMQGRITQERQQRTAKEWQAVRRQVVEFAALEATVSRLSEPSRTLLARLGVPHRPFPLAAIEQGLGAAPSSWQPLLDWSLLRYDPLERTYRLHSLTRRYAEGLQYEQDRTQTQARLAAWNERYADNESLDLADYLEAYRLWRASGNGRSAGVVLIQLMAPLMRSGLYPLLSELCTTTLNDIGESDKWLDKWLTAECLSMLGYTASWQGNYEEARKFFQRSLVIAEWLGNHSDQDRQALSLSQRSQASSLGGLSMIAQLQENYQEEHRFRQREREITEGLVDLYDPLVRRSLRESAELQKGDKQENLLSFVRKLEAAAELDDRRAQAVALFGSGATAEEQGDYEEAQQLYQQSLDIFEQLGDQYQRANMLNSLAIIAQKQRDYEKALRFYQQSLTISEQLGDQRQRAITLDGLGIIAQGQGNYEEARQLFQQSLTIFEQLGNQSKQAQALGQLGDIALRQKHYEEAYRLSQQSLAIFEQLDDQSEQARALGQLGDIAWQQENYKEAQQFYQQSLALFEQLGDQSKQAACLHRLGAIAQEQGNYEEAYRLFQQSLALFKQLGNQSEQAACLHRLGNVAQGQGNYEEARRFSQKGLTIFEQLGDQDKQAHTLGQLGMIAWQQGNYKEAWEFSQQSLTIFEQLGDQHGRAKSLAQLGDIVQEQWNYKEAQQHYQQSLTIFKELGDQSKQAACLLQLGMITSRQGCYEEARKFFQQSLTIFEQLGDQSKQAYTLDQLGLIAQQQENYDEAWEFSQQSLTLFEQLGDQHGRAKDLLKNNFPISRGCAGCGRDRKMRSDRVVPLATDAVMFDIELLHLSIGNLLPFLIGTI